MLKSYLTIALRNLRKYPTTSAIHLVGLTVGLTACLLIGLFIRYEWCFDRYHRLGERIYRVNTIRQYDGKTEYSGITAYPLGPALRLDFPDWTKVTRIHAEENTYSVISAEKILSEEAPLFAEPELLDLFDFDILSGDARKALSQPNQALLTESTARRYFGTTDVIGKTFRLGEKVTIQVAGVIRDMPAQSSLRANLLVSFLTMKDYFEFDLDEWGMSSAGSVFVLLPEGAAPEKYQGRLQKTVAKYMNSDAKAKTTLRLQPLHDIHFNTQYEGTEYVPAVSPTYLWVFGVIGGFMLLIACVNFINLSTARAMIRTREVGVRKSIGATGGQLMGQFLSETLWLTILSAGLTLLLAHLLLPELNRFLEKKIALPWTVAIPFVLTLSLLTTLIAGLYPAWMLSRFNAVRALKGYRQTDRGGQTWLRQGLVVFQFTISLVLAVGVMVIYQQMKLFREKDLGFRKESVLTVNISQSSARPAFRDQLLRLPAVEAVSFALGAPTAESNFNTRLMPNPGNKSTYVGVNVKIADADYLKTYGLQLLAGRFLEHRDTLSNAVSVPSDQRKYVFVVNETATKALGYTRPEQALGQRIQLGINDIQAEIIGVVKDYHVSSLHQAIQPVVMMNFPFFYRSVGIKLNTTNYPATLAAVEKVWKQFNPDILYEASFLDDNLQKLYQEEARQFALLRLSAGLALLIGCLGLWGLSTFLIERRTKEIGIRKVLGASVSNIVTLLSKDFVKLISLAFVLAGPIAWYLMHQWLKDFAYQVSIRWWIFALAGGFALLIALLTVSFQSIRAALTNPVKSLRTE